MKAETTRNVVISTNIPGVKIKTETGITAESGEEPIPEGLAITRVKVDGYGLVGMVGTDDGGVLISWMEAIG